MKYQPHVSALLKLAGAADTDLRAQRIVAPERAIAEKQIASADQQDIGKANNTWKRTDFGTKAPRTGPNSLVEPISASKRFIVWQPAALAMSLSLDAWYTAFGVQPGDKLDLIPPERVLIWWGHRMCCVPVPPGIPFVCDARGALKPACEEALWVLQFLPFPLVPGFTNFSRNPARC